MCQIRYAVLALCTNNDRVIFWRVTIAIITNYTTLKTEVANVLARDDLTADIPLFIQLAENELHGILHLRNEETALSLSVTSGTATVPSDFKGMKLAYVPDSPAVLLRWVSLDEIYRDYPTRNGSSTPFLISREGANFVFGPFAKDFTLTGIYYAKQDGLETTDNSWYVVNYPGVLLYGALVQAAPFILGDERIPTWERMQNRVIDAIETAQRYADTSRGRLIQRVS